uniref:DNA-directed RNA polymerase I subunit RPA43 n=1 Tax=Glossina morsitans morsitans TaxID=37546 RepID=A0A1B0GDA0_GLOMM
MAKRLREYVKYSTKELDLHTKREGACVHKVNTNMHLSIGPYCLADFKTKLKDHIVRTKIGYYDVSLDVLGPLADLRADDYHLHINYNADVYVFKPAIGAVLTGIIKHIGAKHLGVILYRVFNAHLKFPYKLAKEDIQMDQEVKFRVVNHNLLHTYPYIEGELLTANGKEMRMGKKVEGAEELGELVNLIKEELMSDEKELPETSFESKGKVKKTKVSDNSLKTPKKSRAKKVKTTASESTVSTPDYNRLQFENISSSLLQDIKEEPTFGSDAEDLALLNSTGKIETEKSFIANEHSISPTAVVKSEKFVNGIQAALETDLLQNMEEFLPITPKKIKKEKLDNSSDAEGILTPWKFKEEQNSRIKTETMDYSTDGTACSTIRKSKKHKSSQKTLNFSADDTDFSPERRIKKPKGCQREINSNTVHLKRELED